MPTVMSKYNPIILNYANDATEFWLKKYLTIILERINTNVYSNYMSSYLRYTWPCTKEIYRFFNNYNDQSYFEYPIVLCTDHGEPDSYLKDCLSKIKIYDFSLLPQNASTHYYFRSQKFTTESRAVEGDKMVHYYYDSDDEKTEEETYVPYINNVFENSKICEIEDDNDDTVFNEKNEYYSILKDYEVNKIDETDKVDEIDKIINELSLRSA